MTDRDDKLAAKYGHNKPPDPNNATVQAMLDAEAITAGAHGRDNAPLFDPIWSPAMHERARAAVREVQYGLADDSIRLNDANNLADLDQLPDDAVVVWAVGARLAHVGRPHARLERVDWFTSIVQLAQEVNDLQPYTNDTSVRQHPADYELRCNVNIAANCTAPGHDPRVRQPRSNLHHGLPFRWW